MKNISRSEALRQSTGNRMGKELTEAVRGSADSHFCANDSLAIGCYKAVQEAMLRVPEDISVVGFNDISMTKYLVPAAYYGSCADGFYGRRGSEYACGAYLYEPGNQYESFCTCQTGYQRKCK